MKFFMPSFLANYGFGLFIGDNINKYNEINGSCVWKFFLGAFGKKEILYSFAFMKGRLFYWESYRTKSVSGGCKYVYYNRPLLVIKLDNKKCQNHNRAQPHSPHLLKKTIVNNRLFLCSFHDDIAFKKRPSNIKLLYYKKGYLLHIALLMKMNEL